MQVADGIHRLTQGVVNFYLVEDGGRLTLVDAGAPGDWDTFAGAVGSLGRSLDDLETVLLTHAHSDHTGFAERARTDAHAVVRIHREDEAMARTGKGPKNESGVGRYLLRPEAYRTLFGLMRRKGLKVVPIHELSTFDDGETLDVPGRPRVVHAPGHTEGSCAILFERAARVGDRRRARDAQPADGSDGTADRARRAEPGFGARAPLARHARAAPGGRGADRSRRAVDGGIADAVRLAKLAGRS